MDSCSSSDIKPELVSLTRQAKVSPRGEVLMGHTNRKSKKAIGLPKATIY